MEDKFVLCDCGSEILLCRNDIEYKEIQLAIYYYGIDNKPNFYQRLKYCLYHLTTGKKYEDQIIIPYEKAKELRDWIDSIG